MRRQPTTTQPPSSNNYLSTGIGGRNNHLYDYRVDIDLSSKNRVSAVGAMGHVVYINNFGSPYLPPPYEVGDYAVIVPKQYDVEDAYTITPHLTNQFKMGYTRFYMPIINATQGVANYTIGAMGVTNLPLGQAGQEFPGVTFGGSGAGTAVNGIGKLLTTQVAPATWTTEQQLCINTAHYSQQLRHGRQRAVAQGQASVHLWHDLSV
jgi:hypothetical protein